VQKSGIATTSGRQALKCYNHDWFIT